MSSLSPVGRPSAAEVHGTTLTTSGTGPAVTAAPVTTLAWEWRATGCVWRIHHDGCLDGGLAEGIRAMVEAGEARWSGLRPASEVSRMNASAGSAVPVSRETLQLLGACLDWRARTSAAFDPLVPASPAAPGAAPFRGRIVVDRRSGSALIPAGALLDLGGIAKGWLADEAARLLRLAIPAGLVLVDAGGTLVAARGVHLIAVEGPPEEWIAIDEGEAVATAGRTGGRGGPSSATVVAASAAAAEALAAALALRPARIERTRDAARVRVGRACLATAAWDARVPPPAPPQAGSGPISIAPHGHSSTQIPQPLQKSRSNR